VDVTQAMESSSEPGQVHASETFLRWLEAPTSLLEEALRPAAPPRRTTHTAAPTLTSPGGFLATARTARSIGALSSPLASPTARAFKRIATASASLLSPKRSARVVPATSRAEGGAGGALARGDAAVAAAAAAAAASGAVTRRGLGALSPLSLRGEAERSPLMQSRDGEDGESSLDEEEEDETFAEPDGGAAAVAFEPPPARSFPPLARAVPDVRVTKRLEDGSGFLARDRGAALLLGIPW
jgi:hypothetical protein